MKAILNSLRSRIAVESADGILGFDSIESTGQCPEARNWHLRSTQRPWWKIDDVLIRFGGFFLSICYLIGWAPTAM